VSPSGYNCFMETPASADIMLETKGGTIVKALRIHPTMPEIIYVEVQDQKAPWTTTIQRTCLIDNLALQAFYAAHAAEIAQPVAA